MAQQGLTDFIFATVGTDHHRFDRLVRWVDQWLADRACHGFIQSGPAEAPRHAEWQQYLCVEEINALIDRSTSVVCHAGPATISLCWRTGLLPIVIPRRRGA